MGVHGVGDDGADLTPQRIKIIGSTTQGADGAGRRDTGRGQTLCCRLVPSTRYAFLHELPFGAGSFAKDMRHAADDSYGKLPTDCPK